MKFEFLRSRKEIIKHFQLVEYNELRFHVRTMYFVSLIIGFQLTYNESISDLWIAIK